MTSEKSYLISSFQMRIDEKPELSWSMDPFSSLCDINPIKRDNA